MAVPRRRWYGSRRLTGAIGGSPPPAIALIQSRGTQFSDTLAFLAPPKAGNLLVFGSGHRDNNTFVQWNGAGVVNDSGAGLMITNTGPRKSVMGYKFSDGTESGGIQCQWSAGGAPKTLIWIAEFSGIDPGVAPQLVFQSNVVGSVNNWQPGAVTLPKSGLLVTWITVNNGNMSTNAIEPLSIEDFSRFRGNVEQPRCMAAYQFVPLGGIVNGQCSEHGSVASTWCGATLGFSGFL